MRKRQSKFAGARYNMPLYELRKRNGYSQTAFGEMLGGYHKQTVAHVEAGLAAGKIDFWQAVQKRFNIPDADMWALINGIEQPDKHVI